jgi:hypothetical protein
MGVALEALKKHSEQILTVLCSDSEEALAPLLTTREVLIQEFVAAIRRGESLLPTEADELERLEAQILRTLQERRQAVYEELVMLRRSRSADSAYQRGPDQRAAQYVDRAI